MRSSIVMAVAVLVAAAAVSAGTAFAVASAVDDDDAPTPAASADDRPVTDESGDGLSVAEVVRSASRGVVEVSAGGAAETPFGPSRESRSQGSGFVLDREGHVVTNAHVVGQPRPRPSPSPTAGECKRGSSAPMRRPTSPC